MGFFRWMFGVPLAAAITAGLFLTMSALIKSDPNLLPERNLAKPVITSKLKDTDPKPKWERTPLPDAPDDPDVEPYRPTGGKGDVVIDIKPQPVGPIGDRLPGLNRGTTIQVAPPYPDACRAKGIEGVVLVQFDITDRGETTNIQIISSPDRCFDRDVIRAVRGWRFPTESRRGVTEAIRFTFVE